MILWNISHFHGLGLQFWISKVAIQISKISIHWYAIFVVSAFVLGLLYCKINDGKYNIKFEDIFNLSIYVIPICIISARIYYVAFNLEYFLQNPIQILNVRSGGLAIYGGIIGGVITCIMYCKKHKIDILNLLDYIVPALALGQAIGRWGNFVNVEAYGKETSIFLRMGIIENGIYKEVHPTFLYESMVTLLLFFILIILQKKRGYKGQVTYIYLILYSFARIFIEGIRCDSLMFLNVRISQILSVAIFVTFCSVLLYKNKKSKSMIKNDIL